MNTFRFGLVAALLAAGSAHAQLLDPAPQARLQAQPSPEARAFAKMPSPFERRYMVDEGAHPFTWLFEGYRSDPRLRAGINLKRYLALEAGYVERKDRGFHRIDPSDPLDVNGALGTKGFHSYAAVKATLPLSDDLSAYGRLGLSHSERRGADARGRDDKVIGGAYGSFGAKYKLNDKAAVSVEGQKFGKTAEKWGSDTNGNKVDAKLNLGF
jgi:hypothetical protein